MKPGSIQDRYYLRFKGLRVLIISSGMSDKRYVKHLAWVESIIAHIEYFDEFDESTLHKSVLKKANEFHKEYTALIKEQQNNPS